MDATDELCAVLAEETRACDALGALLAEEHEALVTLRPAAVLACVEQRAGLAGKLARLAARRRALVRDLPQVPARIDDAVRSLRRALVAARALERRNGRLAAASLEVAEETLRALRSLAPGARYRADACIDLPAGGERIDRRV